MGPPRMLRGGMKSYITGLSGTKKRYGKRLNCPVQVHVKDGILIMPNPGIWACYLVTDEEDPIIARVRLDLL